MGNSIIIKNSNTWIEGNAIQQLERTATLPNMQRVAGMPDLHAGRGYPVGAAFFSEGRFYPALIGNDIGCGMAFWQTDLPVHQSKKHKLAKQLGSIDAPLDDTWAERIAELLPNCTYPQAGTTDGSERALILQQKRQIQGENASQVEHLTRIFNAEVGDFWCESKRDTSHLLSLGTIGGGNHFAELQAVDKIYAPEKLPENFNRQCLQLLVHSGSRGLGQAILREHVDKFSHAGLAENTPEALDYLAKHDAALQFARVNRQLIAERMLARWGADGAILLDVHHNFLQQVQLDNETGWLHRKGATPSDCGLVVIPGSRGDYSYWVQPIVDKSAHALFSLAHGAGRKWQRSECKGRLSHKYSVDKLRQTDLGSVVICEDKALIYEEAPQAYKNIDDVIAAMLDFGLIELVARFKPVLTYKTAGECC
ncbi:RNA ligase RtcB family protein [Wielerella bovis]|uniref:RNA ligase RtcB family protein n=1 Tax=Wielerella bovis TaxID=2917790 RepID=UPI002019FF6D|nr:RNA ligase RtcB family protein [Wielerella bovis]ULJ62662.1 RNA ligase RtcB family protein [Wielerella bovis]ULJ64887.1 RNA ligase RtcB family protein [Wielerella bovis]ULJ67160.1 RNA ligase RtcB family protein [Wielerella bovis]